MARARLQLRFESRLKDVADGGVVKPRSMPRGCAVKLWSNRGQITVQSNHVNDGQGMVISRSNHGRTGQAEIAESDGPRGHAHSDHITEQGVSHVPPDAMAPAHRRPVRRRRPAAAAAAAS